MFIRAQIFTFFNGFHKVTTAEKRRLAKVLNTLSADINGKAEGTIKSLDCVYRSEIFNTESEESMKRFNELLENLKAAMSDGLSARVKIFNEELFVKAGGHHKKAQTAHNEAGIEVTEYRF